MGSMRGQAELVSRWCRRAIAALAAPACRTSPHCSFLPSAPAATSPAPGAVGAATAAAFWGATSVRALRAGSSAPTAMMAARAMWPEKYTDRQMARQSGSHSTCAGTGRRRGRVGGHGAARTAPEQGPRPVYRTDAQRCMLLVPARLILRRAPPPSPSPPPPRHRCVTHDEAAGGVIQDDGVEHNFEHQPGGVVARLCRPALLVPAAGGAAGRGGEGWQAGWTRWQAASLGRRQVQVQEASVEGAWAGQAGRGSAGGARRGCPSPPPIPAGAVATSPGAAPTPAGPTITQIYQHSDSRSTPLPTPQCRRACKWFCRPQT